MTTPEEHADALVMVVPSPSSGSGPYRVMLGDFYLFANGGSLGAQRDRDEIARRVAEAIRAAVLEEREAAAAENARLRAALAEIDRIARESRNSYEDDFNDAVAVAQEALKPS